MSEPGREPHPAYEALRREYQDFRYYLPDALIEIDLQTLQVVSFNRQAELLFGYGQREAESGLTASHLIPPEEFTGIMSLLQEYVGESRASGSPYQRTGRNDIYEIRMRRRDGAEFWAETQTSFVLDGGGVPVRMLTIIRDITARREREAEHLRLIEDLRKQRED